MNCLFFCNQSNRIYFTAQSSLMSPAELSFNWADSLLVSSLFFFSFRFFYSLFFYSLLFSSYLFYFLLLSLLVPLAASIVNLSSSAVQWSALKWLMWKSSNRLLLFNISYQNIISYWESSQCGPSSIQGKTSLIIDEKNMTTIVKRRVQPASTVSSDQN